MLREFSKEDWRKEFQIQSVGGRSYSIPFSKMTWTQELQTHFICAHCISRSQDLWKSTKEAEETHRLLPYTVGSGRGEGILSRNVYTKQPTKPNWLVQK